MVRPGVSSAFEEYNITGLRNVGSASSTLGVLPVALCLERAHPISAADFAPDILGVCSRIVRGAGTYLVDTGLTERPRDERSTPRVGIAADATEVIAKLRVVARTAGRTCVVACRITLHVMELRHRNRHNVLTLVTRQGDLC